MSGRLTKPWIESYLELMSPMSEGPIRFRWWASAITVAASLKRNVFIQRGRWRLYPNLYVLLVARPGVGKGEEMLAAIETLREANTTNIMADRMTMPYVLDKLSTGFPMTQVTSSGVSIGTSTAAIIFAPELSVFIRNPEEYLPDLTELWDCRDGDRQYATKGGGSKVIKNPSVSMLAGTTPSFFVKSIPPSAIGSGFTRRVNCVYERGSAKRMPWPTPLDGNKPFYDAIIDDLRRISQLRGEMTFEPAAKPLFEQYYSASVPDDLDDEATAVFKTSQWAHASKLAMTLSASRGDSLKISKEDFAMAIKKTNEVIADIKTVFRAVGESDLAEATDKVIQLIETLGYASRERILNTLWRHISKEDLDKVLATLTEGGVVTSKIQGNVVLYYVIGTNTASAAATAAP